MGPRRQAPAPPQSYSINPCDYGAQYDALGRRCGGRSAEVRPGGRLGGDGFFVDPDGNLRMYGPCNDVYDDPSLCGN